MADADEAERAYARAQEARYAADAQCTRESRRACLASVPPLPQGVRAVFYDAVSRVVDETAAQAVRASLRASGAVVLLPRRQCWRRIDAAAFIGEEEPLCRCLAEASTGVLASAAAGRPAAAVREKDGKHVRPRETLPTRRTLTRAPRS